MSDGPTPESLPTSLGAPIWKLKVIGLVILVVILAADLWSKNWMQENGILGASPSERGGRTEIIDGFFAWEGAWNPGVTFGLAAGQTFPILILTGIATLLILTWFAATRTRSKLLHFGLAMIIGGALGNLYDRSQWHEVRDFILNYIVIDGEEKKWPNYNVADAGIVVGVIFVLWDALFGVGAKEAKARADEKDAARKRAKAEAA